MKVVVALDSFKESMSAYEASLAVKEGIHQKDASIETILCPLADGGEGTLETLVRAMNGFVEYYDVHGPLMNMIKAPVGYVNDIAIIECAKVCGLELLSESQKNPYHTSTYGLGELMIHAMNHHVSRLMICLGGSATNDGGIGMLQALGVHFYNRKQNDVEPTMVGLKDIQEIDISHMYSSLKDVSIIGVCDVENPLCGVNGATYVYGPQKGVLLEEREMIDQSMLHYAKLTDQLLQYEYRNQKGTGAAGGLGYALKAYLNAELKKGFDVVSETIDLESQIKDCDIVIVGEGKIDQQTQYGKTPYGVLKIAQKYHKDVYAFAGKVQDEDVLKLLGFQNIYCITPNHMELSLALKMGQENLKKCVYQHMEDMM